MSNYESSRTFLRSLQRSNCKRASSGSSCVQGSWKDSWLSKLKLPSIVPLKQYGLHPSLTSTFLAGPKVSEDCHKELQTFKIARAGDVKVDTKLGELRAESSPNEEVCILESVVFYSQQYA
jgi:hypothetical protein